MGPRARRRRARPPEDQVGHQPLRAHRRAPAAAAVRQRRVRPPPHASRTCAATTTRSSTRSARRPTARWVSPARTSPGSYSATDFVGWYNGHPDFCDLDFDLSGERAIVIGAGNVALDVARMLVLTPRRARGDRHRRPRARRARAQRRARGRSSSRRRGPEQAAFTNPELLELGELSDADVVVDPAELALADGIEDPDADTTARRNVEILRELRRRARRRAPPRAWCCASCSRRCEIRGERPRRVGHARAQRARGRPRRRAARARDRASASRCRRRRVFRAIGYRGTPLAEVPSTSTRGADRQRGRPRAARRIRRRLGQARAERRDRDQQEGRQRDRRACCSRISPPGALLEPEPIGDAALEEFVRERQPELVDYEGWVRIDRHEQGLGEPHGRPRVKLDARSRSCSRSARARA